MKITVHLIKKTVASYYEITPEHLNILIREQYIVLPRQIVIYLSRKLTKNSYKQICNHFGLRNHTTAMYAAKKITNLVKVDKEFAITIQELERRIKVCGDTPSPNCNNLI